MAERDKAAHLALPLKVVHDSSGKLFLAGGPAALRNQEAAIYIRISQRGSRKKGLRDLAKEKDSAASAPSPAQEVSWVAFVCCQAGARASLALLHCSSRRFGCSMGAANRGFGGTA
jgi:hypothetical protein